MRSHEQVNVIRHKHPRMQIAVGKGAVLDGAADEERNLMAFQMNGSVARGVEQAVHCDKRLAGCQAFFWEFAAGRQASVQPKRHEQRLSNRIEMRQTAL